MLIAIQIVTLADEIVLYGYHFTDFNVMKETCMRLFNARSGNTTTTNLFGIYDHTRSCYFAGSPASDPFPLPLAQQPIESLVFPKGEYLLADPKSQEVFDSLIQSPLRIDHNNLIPIEQYDFQNGAILVYYPIRRNGLDLTKLPRLPSAQGQLLREQYISAFVREQRDKTYFLYLWDRFITYTPVSLEDVVRYLDGEEEVCFFWDIHPELSLLHRLGQEYIYTLPLKELIHHYELKNIPDDVYLFDESLSWTIALTHEPHNEHNWKCLCIGNWR